MQLPLNGLKLRSGLFWITAYVLYIRQSYRENCANVGWDLIYGGLYPPAAAEYVAFLPVFLIDLGLVYTTVKFGPARWSYTLLVQQNLPSLLLFGCVTITLSQWPFLSLLLPDIHQASFWSGFFLQNIVSWAANVQLLARGHTKGHSLTIWFMYFVGTLCAIAVVYWRAYFYPDYWGYVYTPAATFLFAAAELGELLYPFIYL
ncbi:hypothetical protein BU23DRAFT_577482 [Bimuria novae-zelandiae CBS 107.79]|uniref:Uncharacterized protein n=1 Tax=Bimuria novae-zelandiae CBS 107.79 TaxID=1447943 RepID=A0A6A5VP40_9PLEO|nr:hypothetical protein BU23DRAFT_577482 [Bimuria novae-zelandiae CBS 107.79]